MGRTERKIDHKQDKEKNRTMGNMRINGGKNAINRNIKWKLRQKKNEVR